jgi:urease accessory protein
MTAKTGPHRDPRTPPKPVAGRARARRSQAERKIGAATAASQAELCDEASLFRLMAWLSPAFPVGAFAYSGGIEWAVEAGDVTDAESLRAWLAPMIVDGAGFCDAVLAAHAHRATSQSDGALTELCELAAAFVPSRERQLETTAQGRAFVEIAQATWPCAALARLVTLNPDAIAYPVAVGVVCAGHRVQLAPALQALLHALASNWISAGVRLVPLGQTDGQRILAALEPLVRETAARAAQASIDDLGSATFRADIAGMRHESQYTRLFRS